MDLKWANSDLKVSVIGNLMEEFLVGIYKISSQPYVIQYLYK